MHWLRGLALMFLIAGLAACGTSAPAGGDGNNGDGDGSTETASKFGQVSMMEMSGGQAMVVGTGSFGAVAEPQPVTSEQQFIDSIADNCTVATAGGEPLPDPDPTPVPDTTSLDAGAALTVEANNATYATLDRAGSSGNFSYATDFTTPPTTPLPDSGLTLTVPGATGGFPAFTDAPFPVVPALTLTSPATTATIDANTTFTWTGDATNTAVIISGSGETSGGGGMSFSCVAADDGTFAFPAATKSELTDAGFSGSLTSVARMGFAVHTADDAALYLMTSRFTDVASQ